MIYPTSFNGESTLISQTSAFSLTIKSGGVVEAKISTDGTNFMNFTTNLRLQINRWQHLAFTYENNGSIKIYIKGINDVTGRRQNTQTGVIFNSTHPINIGTNENSNFFEGTLDEIRLWNNTLSESTIKAIQRKVVPTQIKGLVAYYNCNQGAADGNNSSITQLLDKTSNNLNGQLIGFRKTGNTSNFVNGISGDFQNDKIAQNTFVNSGNWSNPNNWSFGVVPTKIDRAVVDENQTITIDSSNLEVDDLVLANNATLKIPKNNAIIINNDFESNGNLELDSDTTDSGVLMVHGSTTGTITYKRGGLLANKWSIVTPPVSGQKIKEFAQNTDNDIRVNTSVNPNRFAIAAYDDNKPAGQRWRYYNENTDENEEFIAGQSYSISRATDGTVTFTGKLNVDNLKKTLIAGQWNAIGNPFTTYYPANKNDNNSFLTDNFDILDDAFKSLYIWDNTQNKYVAVSNVSETAKSLPPGQGFFVKLKNEEAEINFQKDKRTFKPNSGNSDFEKNTQEPTLKIIAKNGKTEVATHIKFFENATIGFDAGYDIGNFEATNFDMYTQLSYSESTQKFTIQSLSNSFIEDYKIPIGIKGKQNDIIKFNAVTSNLPTTVNLFLEDRLTNSFVDLKNKNASYSFKLKENLNSIGRFFIHFTTSVLTTSNSVAEQFDFYVANKTLFFSSNMNSKLQISIYSILGKKVFQQKMNSLNSKSLKLNTLGNGIYLVKIKSDDVVLSKKIILN